MSRIINCKKLLIVVFFISIFNNLSCNIISKEKKPKLTTLTEEQISGIFDSLTSVIDITGKVLDKAVILKRIFEDVKKLPE